MGAVLRASSRLYRVFAPYSHALPVIHSACDATGTSNLRADVLITSCWTGIDHMPQSSPLFKGIWPEKCANGQSFTVVDSSTRLSDYRQSNLHDANPPDRRDGACWTSFTCPPDWQAITKPFSEGFKSARSILVCGPGKSTVHRYLVNRYLTRAATCPQGVAFLDLDPVQPEFGAPGELALSLIKSCILGPPFTHPQFAESSGSCTLQSHYIGSAGPRDDSEYYMRCAIELRRKFEKGPALMGCPLVINAHGLTPGRGHEILKALMQQLKVTDLFYVQNPGLEESYQQLRELAAEPAIQFHVLSSPGSEVSSRSAPELQTMQMSSYFHSSPRDIGLCWIPAPLHLAEPLEICFSGPSRTLEAVVILGDQIATDSVFETINGTVVGLILVRKKNKPGQVVSQQGYMLSGGYREPIHPQFAQANGSRQNIRPTSDGANHEQVISPFQDALHFLFDGASVDNDLNLCSGADPYLVDPSQSRIVTQALVRGVDLQRKTLQVITPMRPALITSSSAEDSLVLVKAKTEAWTNLVLGSHQGHAGLRKMNRQHLHVIRDTSQGELATDRTRGIDPSVVHWITMAPHVHETRIGDDLRKRKVWKVRKNLKNTRSSIKEAQKP